MASDPIIRTHELRRSYGSAAREVRAVDGVSMHVDEAEFIAIVGASGSGKTTLLNLLAGLDSPTSGIINVRGVSLGSLSRRSLASYRARRVGMMFQSFNLIAHRSALENVELALYFNGSPRRARRSAATAILERLGLGDRLTHHPGDLSGGEQQRVALARALVKNPEILFADEPTGNLDRVNAEEIMSLLGELNGGGLTILMVTHDLETARRIAHRVVRMHYGKLDADALGGEVLR